MPARCSRCTRGATPCTSRRAVPAAARRRCRRGTPEVERMASLEPAASTLARWRSPTELHPQSAMHAAGQIRKLHRGNLLRSDPMAVDATMVRNTGLRGRCHTGALPAAEKNKKGPDPRGVRASGKRCAQGVATRSPLPDWRSDPHGWRSQAAAQRPWTRRPQTIHGPLGGSCSLRWGEPFSRWVLGWNGCLGEARERTIKNLHKRCQVPAQSLLATLRSEHSSE